MDHHDEKKTERIWLKVGPSLKADLEEQAKKDRRPVAEYARLGLERLVEGKKRKEKK